MSGARRELEPKMIAFFEDKLKGNGLYLDAVARKDARTIFGLAAQVCVGIREVGGNNKGPMVELIQDTIGGHSAEAWCMAFVQTCLAFAEYKTGIVSPILGSEGCAQVWAGTPVIQRVKTIPAAFAIVIWGHYDVKGHYLGGHTGIVESTDGDTFYAYEGNTTGGIVGGKVERDGGGCYRTHRSMRGDGNMKVRGFLIPFNAPLTKVTV